MLGSAIYRCRLVNFSSTPVKANITEFANRLRAAWR